MLFSELTKLWRINVSVDLVKLWIMLIRYIFS